MRSGPRDVLDGFEDVARYFSKAEQYVSDAVESINDRTLTYRNARMYVPFFCWAQVLSTYTYGSLFVVDDFDVWFIYEYKSILLTADICLNLVKKCL